MNRHIHIALLLPGMVLAWVLSGLVTSGQQSQNQQSGGNKQYYPTKSGGKGKVVTNYKGGPTNANNNTKVGSSGGGGVIIPRPTITFSPYRLRLRRLRTPMNRRLPTSRPAMSAISGARFQRGLTTASTNSTPVKGKSTP